MLNGNAAQFKQIFDPVPGMANLELLRNRIGDEVGTVSREVYPRNFPDNLIRDCVDVIFPVDGSEVIGAPTECFRFAETADQIPPWS